jgi:DNA-directed RNA polymerase subunit beta
MTSILTATNDCYRHSFGRIKPAIEIPDLLELQKQFYAEFLQNDVPSEKRKNAGLQSVFTSIFPINNFADTASLEFLEYNLGNPKYDVNECRNRGTTFSAPLKVTVRLVVKDVDQDTGAKSIRDVKVQEVYLGDIPLMTEQGSFIVNGTERVVVSQLHRSPGVFYSYAVHASGKLLYTARVIPYRGSWLDFEFDHKELLFCRVDRRRKMPATVIFKALGMTTEEILRSFYATEKIIIRGVGSFERDVDLNLLTGIRADNDVINPKTGKILVKKNRKFTKALIEKLKEEKVSTISIDPDTVYTKISARDVYDTETGEILLELNEQITEEKVKYLLDRNIKEIEVLYIDGVNVGSFMRDTLLVDKISTREDALIEIYRRLRPGDPPTLDAAKNLFENLFFNPTRYDLSEVGRIKINHKFNFSDVPSDNTTLRKEDIVTIVKYLCDLKMDKGEVDDIDHLGNRRVRAVGELLENQYRVGLIRMERAVREKMSLQDIETQMPYQLINSKPVTAAVKEFFGSSQLSQFMDQTNPLSEMTHKRRLSALGPGGLSRDRAGFEVRDVHTTHYGRICPIETPEGPNIGLISSMTTYARVNKYGFIETPYRRVIDSKVTDEVIYCSALDEEGHKIAQANSPVDKKGKLIDEMVNVRVSGQYKLYPREEVTLMDVSPNQLVSVAAALIPFLEHDDANRALMGSNMQRQAVPCLQTDSPNVGTGLEKICGNSGGATLVCRRHGVVETVDANRIIVRSLETPKEGDVGVDVYYLTKYRRSNQNTCFNEKPVVSVGDVVRKGDVLADGPATDRGELAMGKNILIGFMLWGGYNFEDSILVSEELIRNDVFTSIHIEEFECVARDTKLGKEEITRDIPNISEESLKDLDETGVIRIGAEVKPGDILVGKITPKGESMLSPEEKLLRAIFGEKAREVKDTSLRVGPGIVGTVIDAKVFSREGSESDSRLRSIQEDQISRHERDRKTEIQIIKNVASDRLKKLLNGKKTTGKLLSEDGKQELLKSGEVISKERFREIPFELLNYIPLKEDTEEEVSEIIKTVNKQIETINAVYQERVENIKKVDELLPGVIKMVKVSIAIKRKLSVGDKMAGRHGNKGVISRILPVEDMPYTEDGEPLQIVLNPLGVPSRMNVGQILEVNLGWASKGIAEKINSFLEAWNPENLKKYIKGIYSSPKIDELLDKASDKELKRMAKIMVEKGVKFETPVFDAAKESEIQDLLEYAGLPREGRTTLFDGRTGEPFYNDVTIGYMYIFKLHHLVEDKIHARSTGPYSLVTQQPLGGKAQFGGQRLGEMEVWAMEAYGAAYTLQEFLTVKSDDVAGRTRAYEAIVKGEAVHEPGLPESFRVLLKELQSLALNIELIESEVSQ